MGREGFKGLIVWVRAKDLAVKVYKVSGRGALFKDFGLRDQIRRCVVSIPSNLAEGDERDTDKDSVRFFYIAKGSLAELRTQLQIAFEIGYTERDIFEELDQECIQLGKMIGSLIKKRGNKIRR
jgi:four helix bundle protein